MNRTMDILIETLIFRNEVEWNHFLGDYVSLSDETKPLCYYSTEVEEAYKILDKLKDSTMMYYSYMYIGEKHRFSNFTEDNARWEVAHQNWCAAVCISALNSIRHDKEEIRDAIFIYNYNEGYL